MTFITKLIGVLAIVGSGVDFALFEDPPAQERDYGRTCLALAMFAEARGQSDAGLAAVGQVILNRVADPTHRWPESICGVVQEPGQFIGVDIWAYPRHPEVRDLPEWNRAQDMADALIDGRGPPLGSCATATSFNQSVGGAHALCRLGAHTFYTDPVRIARLAP